MHAQERLYLTAGRDRLVRDGDKAAAFLYAAVGDEIPQSAADRFGIVNGKLKGRAGKVQLIALRGSDILPAVVEIAGGVSLQLAAIVARAHRESGLDEDAWNALPEADREERLQKTIDGLKAEAAAKTPTKTAAPPKPTRKPKAAKAAKEQKPAEDKEQKGGTDKGGSGAASEQAKD